MKKLDDPIYLSAKEAAAELSVSHATLYAYVSRGLVRSEPTADSRAKRYRADDIRTLKNRRQTNDTAAKNVSETSVLDSEISTITEQGPLYRGVLATNLAEQASLEETATLLWNVHSEDPFSTHNLLPQSEAMNLMRGAVQTRSPLARAIALAALTSEKDPRAFNRSSTGQAETGARVMRSICAAILNAEPSSKAIHAQIAEAWAPENEPVRDLIRRALVLLAEHELNASTYTVRCAVSTGLNFYDAAIAGLAALKGPGHGGAGALASRLVATLAEGDARQKIHERTALGETFHGFGHVVYKHGDPRAENLLAAIAHSSGEAKLCHDVPALVRDATGLFPTIDYALAVMAHLFGLPTGSEISLFAIARTAGWIAHAMEQQTTGSLIRPRARYIGPAPGRTQAVEPI